jgi:hypothetical protein
MPASRARETPSRRTVWRRRPGDRVLSDTSVELEAHGREAVGPDGHIPGLALWRQQGRIGVRHDAVRSRRQTDFDRSASASCSTGLAWCATLAGVKTFTHARLGAEERAVLDALKRSTGLTESEIVRRGLHLVAEEERRRRSALECAGRSAGRFRRGPRDLSTNPNQLDGFGS